jgi:hypothetical protein
MYLFQKTNIIVLILLFASGQIIKSFAAYIPITIEDTKGTTSIKNVKKIIFNGAILSNENNGEITIFVSDSDTLDNIDSSQFLRSDTSTSYTGGTLTLNPGTTLNILGSLRYSDGSENNNYILKSDANGLATWVSPDSISVTGDNLGNHNAGQNLNMAGNNITNVEIITTATTNSDVINLAAQVEQPTNPNPGDIYYDSSHAICVFMNGSWIKMVGIGNCDG